jgi:hypothetical protein
MALLYLFQFALGTFQALLRCFKLRRTLPLVSLQPPSYCSHHAPRFPVPQELEERQAKAEQDTARLRSEASTVAHRHDKAAGDLRRRAEAAEKALADREAELSKARGAAAETEAKASLLSMALPTWLLVCIVCAPLRALPGSTVCSNAYDSYFPYRPTSV